MPELEAMGSLITSETDTMSSMKFSMLAAERAFRSELSTGIGMWCKDAYEREPELDERAGGTRSMAGSAWR